jgi:peptide/nickel transport system substrate-binding protein
MLNRRDFLMAASTIPLALYAGTSRGAEQLAADAASTSLTLAFPADVPSWDPGGNASAQTLPIHKSVFDTAIELSPDLKIVPGIITSHRWLDTEGKTLEMNLRDGVTFHNGDAFTSDDLKFSFYDRPQADEKSLAGANWRTTIAGIETPSPNKAVIHFSQPFVSSIGQFLNISGFVVPRRYYESVGQQGFIDKPVGSGPYRLVDYQRDSRVVLEAYEKYWAGPARFKRVTFQIAKDPSARIAAIQSGQVDFTYSIPLREVARLGGLPGLVANEHPTTATMLMHMVNRGIYQDINVRLAMHHAIDKQTLSNAFYNGKAIPQSMFSAKGLAGNDPNFVFPYDPEKAKALLAKSGYSASKPAKIEFGTTSGSFPSDYDVARAIVQMWKSVGIEADLKVLPVDQFYDLSRSGKLEFPMIVQWINASGDPLLLTGLILDPVKRFSVWKSDDIPPRLDPLLNEIDDDKRNAGFEKFDVWAAQQGYEVSLLELPATAVYAKRVGYKPYLNGWMLPYYWAPV